MNHLFNWNFDGLSVSESIMHVFSAIRIFIIDGYSFCFWRRMFHRWENLYCLPDADYSSYEETERVLVCPVD